MKPYVWIVGFPRCGSVSMCDALRILGWDAIHNPRHWDMLHPHQAAGDVFITAHWRELLRMFPHSRFVLNTRNVEDWLISLQRIPLFWKSRHMFDRYHRVKVYGTQDVNDQAALRLRWDAHHREIRERVSPDRLLVFHQPFTWEPLCKFLNVPVPRVAFPWRNRLKNTDASVRRPQANREV